MRVIFLLCRIDARVVAIDRKPRRTGSKARIGAVIPLHGGAGIIAAFGLYHAPAQRIRQMQLFAHIPDIDGFHILYLFHVGEIEIGHTDLLPFIQKRCSPQGKNERGKCLGAFIMILGIIAEARNRAGLIVVFKINGIPRQSLLPLG